MPPNFEPNFQPTQPPAPEGRPNMPPPTPNPLKQDHSMPFGEQHTVDVNNLPKNAGNNLFQPSTAPASPSPDYDFILNAQHPAHTFNTPLPKGRLGKVVVGAAGAFVVIILIAIISSLVKSPSNLPYFEAVAQDQQELIHIASNAATEPDISSGNQKFISTASLTLSSNSSSLQAYLAANGTKLSSKTLALKISTATDTQLTSAESSGSFNSTFSQVANSQLNGYLADLRAAYAKTSGSHGRALLSSLYNQANLLIVSLANGS